MERANVVDSHIAEIQTRSKLLFGGHTAAREYRHKLTPTGVRSVGIILLTFIAIAAKYLE